MIRSVGGLSRHETSWAARAAAAAVLQAFQVRDRCVESVALFAQLSQHAFQIQHKYALPEDDRLVEPRRLLLLIAAKVTKTAAP